ncbi:lectin BRA-3-like [Ptychodera flava]|uniref:lectin BRA-3-like n=1 Tax=Ptychodera flava TaxID=63121 RepID=UPI00396A972E
MKYLLILVALSGATSVYGNWEKCIDGDLFVIDSLSRSWEASKTLCSQNGGHLAVLATEDLTTQFKQFLNDENLDAHISKGMWIGFNDIQQEGTFTWIDGTAWDYTDWFRTQPDNNNKRDSCHGQDCGQIWKWPRSNPTWQWDDDYCFKSKPHVCQYESHQTCNTP